MPSRSNSSSARTDSVKRSGASPLLSTALVVVILNLSLLTWEVSAFPAAVKVQDEDYEQILNQISHVRHESRSISQARREEPPATPYHCKETFDLLPKECVIAGVRRSAASMARFNSDQEKEANAALPLKIGIGQRFLHDLGRYRRRAGHSDSNDEFQKAVRSQGLAAGSYGLATNRRRSGGDAALCETMLEFLDKHCRGVFMTNG